jgi:tetratricopeptide (TPR) repeat protein
MGDVLCSLGLHCQRTTRYDQALRCHEEALALARRMGERDREAQALVFMGSTYLMQWCYAEAMAYLAPALEIAQEIGNRDLEGYARRNLGRIWARSGDTLKAHNHLEAALAIVKETGNRDLEMETLNGFGQLIVARDAQSAMDYHRRSLAIALEIGDRWHQAQAYEGVAYASFKLGQSAAAHKSHLQAIAIYRQLGFRADL